MEFFNLDCVNSSPKFRRSHGQDVSDIAAHAGGDAGQVHDVDRNAEGEQVRVRGDVTAP